MRRRELSAAAKVNQFNIKLLTKEVRGRLQNLMAFTALACVRLRRLSSLPSHTPQERTELMHGADFSSLNFSLILINSPSFLIHINGLE